MREPRTGFPGAPAVLFVLLLLATLAGCGGADATGATGAAKDPLAAEIRRSSALLTSPAAAGGLWAPVKRRAGPALTEADKALRDGRRWLALQKLAAAKVDIATAAYLAGRRAGDRQAAGFEAEWARMGGELRADLKPAAAAFDGVEPAAVRALGEAALPQVRAYYEASLDYGRSTMPDSGLYYLGNALGERELAAFCRTLSAPAGRRAPPVRPLGPELDTLEADLLRAYRPPASLDRHGQFIVASATLKEARELDAAGLRHGALLRYLEAAQRVAALRSPRPPAPDASALAGQLRRLDARLSAGGVDHSLGRMFLEAAQAALPAGDAQPAQAALPAQDATAPQPSAAAAAAAAVIAGDVLPRYFAALAPAPSRPPRPAPEVTVTLVRWPYT